MVIRAIVACTLTTAQNAHCGLADHTARTNNISVLDRSDKEMAEVPAWSLRLFPPDEDVRSSNTRINLFC
jgi:hypothetical protein